MIKSSLSLVLAAALCGLPLAGCTVQWVSPYNADLQKRATDMLSDVVAWEAHMRDVAGTPAADPRNPDVQAKLETWKGDIEAMSAIEVGIDPGSTTCDEVLQRIQPLIAGQFSTAANSVVLPAQTASASSESQVITHCETLPDTFSRMTKRVEGVAGDCSPIDASGQALLAQFDLCGGAKGTPPPKGIIVELQQQCEMANLPDTYFTSQGQKPGTAPKADATAKARCKDLFVKSAGQLHGNLVDGLATALEAIIYREGRQAPKSKS